MALTDSLANEIAADVAEQIIEQTKKEGKASDYAVPRENWEKIVKLIVSRVFTEIRQNAVVELDQVTLAPGVNSTLVSAAPGSPVTGGISGPAQKLKGKIT